MLALRWEGMNRPNRALWPWLWWYKYMWRTLPEKKANITLHIYIHVFYQFSKAPSDVSLLTCGVPWSVLRCLANMQDDFDMTITWVTSYQVLNSWTGPKTSSPDCPNQKCQPLCQPDPWQHVYWPCTRIQAAPVHETVRAPESRKMQTSCIGNAFKEAYKNSGSVCLAPVFHRLLQCLAQRGQRWSRWCAPDTCPLAQCIHKGSTPCWSEAACGSPKARPVKCSFFHSHKFL